MYRTPLHRALYRCECTSVYISKYHFQEPSNINSLFSDLRNELIRVMKTNLMHYLSSVYFVNKPLHVSGIFVAHHQEVYCIYIQQLVRVVLFSWLFVGKQTANWKVQHVPFVVYIQCTSWWWATNMPETCRGWMTKQTEDKQCIKLGFITRRRGIEMHGKKKNTKKKELNGEKKNYVGNDIIIYLLIAIGLWPGGRSTVHIYTQTIHRTIRNKQYIEQHNNFGRVRAVPRLG